MSKQVRSVFIAATIFWAAGVIASGQILTVTYPAASVVTPPLSQLPDGPKPNGNSEHAHRPVPSHAGRGGGQDTAVQSSAGPLIAATGGTSFDGPGANGFAPSDSNIAVGPNHIFAAVNSVYQIYNKSGVSVLGPKSLSSLWTGVGGGCATANAGDVVVQYDKLADRWVLTELSSLSSPYGECIAVSTTGDPTGTYKAYYYSFGSNLPDYPKFGVWPTATNSAYLASYNQFANGQNFAGAALCAYDRSAMLAAAASPAQICYTLSNDGSFLPSDLDGSTAPADGSPGLFLTYETLSSLRIWKLAPNFAAPSSSSLTQATPDLAVTPFSQLCNGGTCVPQGGTNNQLDSLADRPMYRLAYRNFGDHQAMVFTHSVTGGPRWYELRANPGAAFSVFQQGTFAPDATFRWMGSAAMDRNGDLAVGYSASSSSIHPAIRYSGRVPGDAPGTLASESSMIEGGGSQTNNLHRWGDYTSLRIDPADDCTFWYINEYLKADGAYNWSTRVGSFKFTACGNSASPDFSLSASPSSVTIAQGAAATSTIAATSLGGYSKSIALSVNCPAGAVCSFTPSAVIPPASGSASASLSITGLAAGTYSLTVSGTDGTLTHTTPLFVTVQSSSDFSLSAPSTASVARKGSTQVTVSLTAIGSSSSVTLSVSGLPAKVTAQFSPNPATASGTSTLTFSANPAATRGSYPLTITGTSGTRSHSVPLTLTVN